MDKEKILKAGKISIETKKFAKKIIKKNIKIEDKIKELGGELAFPINLSINNIAAHYTPSHDDQTLAHGLLKVDIGVHVDGWIADTAFSIDIEDSDQNKKLIQISEKALESATSIIKKKITTSEIGKTISESIKSSGFSPIINLSGHEITRYEVHADITIPNIDDKKNITLKNGLYAIEPFVTTGSGRVHESKPSGIYSLVNTKPPRSQIAREILIFITDKYKTLPFCERWLVKQFGTRALIGLKQLEQNNNIHQYSQLADIKGSIISQAEHTILIDDEIIVTTK
jgi:methionyl aminopeptidase